MGSKDKPGGAGDASTQQVLGYLNFSSGSADPQYLLSLNKLFQRCSTEGAEAEPTWRRVCAHLLEQLSQLEGSSPTFSDVRQARRVLELALEFCPLYREFHSDLLAHQSDNALFNCFFIGRVTEALLKSNPLLDDAATVHERVMRFLNDYIGYRPVATLESQKIEPYDHERVRPIPIYIEGAGAATGIYESIVTECIGLLDSTDPHILRQAYFDPSKLDELAIDPRAYDFDHPANKRPNYHFGQWDPHCIDGDGFYRRFVVQQVTIDCLLNRAYETEGVPKNQLITEAAAVLAGTILMSSGISGCGPGTHDSSVTLASLLVQIAAYRDEFYEQLLERFDGSHSARLREEASRLQQPFAGARQDLNRRLTECRAVQLQRVHLTKIYARMNYSEAATAQAELIQVPSARISCQIDCKLSEAKSAIDSGDLPRSLQCAEEVRDVVIRGIHCGAIVDPWNMLGFDGNFSLFGSIENSLRDYRIDDLVDIVEELLEVYAQLWSKAAATQNDVLASDASDRFKEFANWWHQFAAHELDSVAAEDPIEVYHAAKNVADALRAWHEAGEASGDIGFWAPHVQDFDSCRAYWLVVDTLLSRDDKVAAQGLLMHWLSQADRIPLEHGETSFYGLVLRWVAAALKEADDSPIKEPRRGWKRIRQFFDYLEANAGDYWHAPQFSPDEAVTAWPAGEDLEEQDDDEEDTFSAAYDNVVYRDSTDDGIEGNIFDTDSNVEDELQQASHPIVTRLTFIEQLACLWKLIAVAWSTAESTNTPSSVDEETAEQIVDLLSTAHRHLTQTAHDLDELLLSVSRYRIGHAGANPEAMVTYDRLRLLKDSLTDQIMNAQVSVAEGLQFVSATMTATPKSSDRLPVQLFRACLRSDRATAEKTWPLVREDLRDKPILYVPLNRGGPPTSIVNVRARQQLVQNLLYWLPRTGCLNETFQLVELVRIMELTPVGSGAITEFDDLFEVGCQAVVNALVDSRELSPSEASDNDWLVMHLEAMMEPLLRGWLEHSRTLRLSVLEQVIDEDAWNGLVEFITEYGRDLFTQRFLNLGNIRGILHQGVDSWLNAVEELEDEEYQPVLDALEHRLERQEFISKLTLVLEAVIENYSEYRDYNSTTTQSDRGDLLYTLLDFLRLRISYDRVVWNLRPLVLAHQVLASRGCEASAEQWRRSLLERIRGEAKRHINGLQQLQQKYAMRLPSISKRLSERFMRPLMIDYLCALVEPAMFHEEAEERQMAFDKIQAQAETFLSEPSGAGLDVPTWLIAMEDTVRGVFEKNKSLVDLMESRMLPTVAISIEEIQAVVDSWRDTGQDSG